MNRLTEGIIWASAGAGLGYLLARRNLEIEYQKRLNLQIDNANDYYRRKYERQLREERKKDLGETRETLETLVEESPVSDKPVDWEEVEKTVSEPEEEQEPESIIADAGLSTTMTNYQGMFKGEMAPTEHVVVERGPTIEEHEEAPEDPSPPSKNPDKLPVEISEEAFLDNHSGFRQVSCVYYAGDDILGSETNKVVPENIRRLMLGDDMLERLKTGIDGAKVLYVRNEKTKVDYEVFIQPEAYVDAVGPIGSVE
jgi:hypothetical protein